MLLKFQKEAYDYIINALPSNRFLILEGPIGNGKSTIVNFLLSDKNIDYLYDRLHFNSSIEKSYTSYSGISDELKKK